MGVSTHKNNRMRCLVTITNIHVLFAVFRFTVLRFAGWWDVRCLIHDDVDGRAGSGLCMKFHVL